MDVISVLIAAFILAVFYFWRQGSVQRNAPNRPLRDASQQGLQTEAGQPVSSRMTEDGIGQRRKAIITSILLSRMSEMENVSVDDITEIVEIFSDLDRCTSWLQNECAICSDKYPENKMQSMFVCQHRVCKGCLKQHFSIVVREKDVNDFGCPICGRPNFYSSDPREREDRSLHLQLLDALMKELVNADTYDLYDKKVMQWTLQQDDDFRWCAHCECGVMYDGGDKMIVCPQCAKGTCAECGKPWVSQHRDISCEAFSRWQAENEVLSKTGVKEILAETGIECPNCKFIYQIVDGGCMHLTCSRCKHEFCSGCRQTITRSMLRGLSAQHPRDCFYYLRDYQVSSLLRLLDDHDVSHSCTYRDDSLRSGCWVREQKEVGQDEEACGRDAKLTYGGMCETHYRRYLVGLINKNKLDPIEVMDESQLITLCGRYNLKVPTRLSGETLPSHLDKLRRVIVNAKPLSS